MWAKNGGRKIEQNMRGHFSPCIFRPPDFRNVQHGRAFDRTEICRTIDAEQMKLAEGYEIPNHLSQLLEQTQRTMELSHA